MHFYVIILITSIIICPPICIEGENYCNKCNLLTNLCFKCQLDILIPDYNGGCIGAKKCLNGKNYCNKCDDKGELCNKCENGYIPDKNGGCSYTSNCKISNKGECIECEDDYLLIGKEKEFKLCKYLDIDDFKNCKEIDKESGKCKICNEGYFLNFGDKKCTKVENCDESIYGNCLSCCSGFFLNKKNNTCLLKLNNFMYCKLSLDGENCETCDEESYLDEKGKCSQSNHCSESLNGNCLKCTSNYYLSSNSFCSIEKNCLKADKDTAICTLCENKYYLDLNNYKCKSNQEENDFKYCQKVKNEQCTECISGYILSEDSKCTETYHCIEAENGNCILCADNYYLGLDHRCTNVEHCIYSSNSGFCDECEDNYYYNSLKNICSKSTENYENCKISNGNICTKCKNDFYLKNDSTCVDNTQKGPFYKCAYADSNNEFCEICLSNYYLGSGDKNCSLIDNCKRSEDEYNCLECEEYYCLDLKKGICIGNDYIEDENSIFYFACNKTNKEGKACEVCSNGYEVGENGYCVDVSRCLEEKDGECLRCTEEKNINDYNYCANKIFGCVESASDNCLRCDNLFEIFRCTECKEGYTLNPYIGCIKKKE